MNNARPNIVGIIERTLHIKTLVESGTAFAIEFNDQQYLITAKHVVDGVPPGETVRIYSDHGLAVVPPVRIKTSDGSPEAGAVDVAALQMPQPLPFNSSQPTLGCPEDLYVPQSVAMPTAEYYAAFGTRFVVTTRTGTIAAVVRSGQRGPYTGDFLVGVEAYPGFSGSPVVYWNDDGQPRIAGVAARLSWRTIPTFGPGPVHSGFIGCFHISHAMKLISAME